MAYITGTTTSVKNSELIKPPIITHARPFFHSAPAPEAMAIGNIPITIGGDLIVGIDDQEVQDQQELARVMNSHRAGDSVKVTIYRGKRKMDIQVTLGEARQQV